jgi:hypothetical protein
MGASHSRPNSVIQLTATVVGGRGFVTTLANRLAATFSMGMSENGAGGNLFITNNRISPLTARLVHFEFAWIVSSESLAAPVLDSYVRDRLGFSIREYLSGDTIDARGRFHDRNSITPPAHDSVRTFLTFRRPIPGTARLVSASETLEPGPALDFIFHSGLPKRIADDAAVPVLYDTPANGIR